MSPKKHIFLLRFALFAALLVVYAGGHVLAMEFYVAPTGNDTNPGSITRPFATLEAAQTAIRNAKNAGLLGGGMMVWIRGGIYVRSQTFQLTAQDSGGACAPIIYSGYPGEIARIIGGKVIAGFKPITNLNVLARLSPAAQTNVLVLNLVANGITNFGKFAERGMGLNLPSVPAHLELFYNGQTMTVARWPNVGQWNYIAGFPTKGEYSSTVGNITNGFIYTGNRPNSWQNPTNIWVHGYWDYDWADSYEHISSINIVNDTITTSPRYAQYGFRTGQRYYFLNILEELDQPGEFYTDTGNGLLYFWPPSPVSSSEAIASVLETPLVSINSATNLIFSNLTFQATRASGFNLTGAVSNILNNVTISEIGNTAVNVSGGQGCSILNCNFTDIGDAGLILSGGDRSTLTPSGHLVQNCHFNNVARWSRTFNPAISLSGVGQRANGNLVENHPHNAIWFDGNEHTIEYNEVRNVAYETGDVGAIYGGRDYTYRGNIIRYNYLHEIYGAGLWGARGVYMDDCLSGTQIYGNIFLDVSNAVFIGGGRDLTIKNNIFINSNPWVAGDGRALLPAWTNLVTILKQRLNAVPAALYRARYPAICDLDKYLTNNLGVPPEHDLLQNNICVGNLVTQISREAVPYIEMTNNYLGQNPGFVNATNFGAGGFQLNAAAEVLTTGFNQIPFASISLHTNILLLQTPNRLRINN